VNQKIRNGGNVGYQPNDRGRNRRLFSICFTSRRHVMQGQAEEMMITRQRSRAEAWSTVAVITSKVR